MTVPFEIFQECTKFFPDVNNENIERIVVSLFEDYTEFKEIE